MDSMITIVAPVRGADVAAVNLAIDALGNPCREPLRTALNGRGTDGAGVHFLSLHAISDPDGVEGHILFEFTADGDFPTALRRIVHAIGADLEPIFVIARDWRGNIDLFTYLERHKIGVGSGLFANPGLCFAGTPGMSVGRICAEAELAKFVSGLVDDHEPDQRPIDRLAAVRSAVAGSNFAWALEPPPPPGRQGREINILSGLALFAWPFIRTYLWPLGLALVLLFAAVWMEWSLWTALKVTAWTLAGSLAAGALLFYTRLRSLEKSDWTDSRAPDAATLLEIRKRENHCAQNHMISVTVRKPGPVRRLTLRMAFWLIGMMASRVYNEGFLGGISTIHAARWITVPGTRLLVFFSNFGGSWESYLEDFITRAHEGLTAVWSNSIGFPRAKNLFQDGATDGERFKRYARASMLPTRFWYSAYPTLTTDHVRCNAAMRRGLAAALTNDEAAQWLALFGSAARPDAKLESSQIQSLVFGGLGFMPNGVCLLLDLPEAEADARAFVARLYPKTAFGDGRKLRRDAIFTIAFGPAALGRLGLPEDCTRGFPAAFLEGMTAPGRDRILGDLEENAKEHWRWGQTTPDVALLVYGRTAKAVAALEAEVMAAAAKAGMKTPYRIPLEPTKKPAIEPFGFVDGVSQPIVRGSYQSYRNHDPIHLVEPGEFILGYPDNRGNFPPEPELNPLADPANVLPVADRSRAFGNSIVEAPRALGRNGTFLVIRQLEQDVAAFHAYCAAEAKRLKGRLPPPYEVLPEYIEAKLVGRWHDGSSLVRNPYYPFETEVERAAKRESARAKANVGKGKDAASPPAAAAATSRPASRTGDPGDDIAPAGGAARKADNDFLYGVEDPQALRCPFGAHIRRANPRDSLAPGSMEQVSISNRHRMLRVGRLYRPGKGEKPGLMFMCLNGDIERQFEFIQQTWLVSPAFHGLTGEQDPLNSAGKGDAARGYLVPTMDGPVRLNPLPRFVTTLGGGYFFMPSRSLLAFLGGC